MSAWKFESDVATERQRAQALRQLQRRHQLADDTFISWLDRGLSVEQAAREALVVVDRRGWSSGLASGGMTKSEAAGYSLLRAVTALAMGEPSRAKNELDLSQLLADRLGRKIDASKSFLVPLEVLSRDLTAASGSGGGYLVATQNVGFIEILRNRSVVFNMGARRLSGLQGSVTVPRHTTAGTAYWLTNESTQITESNQVFGQLALSPKTVGAYTEVSRQLTLQSSPDAESIVMADLGAVVATAVDLAALNGSGSGGEPRGIINTSGIGSVTGTSIDYAKVLEFQTDVAGGNALSPACGYVTTTAVAGLLAQRVKVSSTYSPLWEGSLLDGSMIGFRAMSSNQMPSATMLFGDFSQVIIAEWGVLEVMVNPFANFQAGIIGIRAMYTVDVGVRYAAAFSFASSIT